MISEVDLRDWDKIEFEPAERCLSAVSYQENDVFDVMEKFISDVRELRRKQMARVPSLLQRKA